MKKIMRAFAIGAALLAVQGGAVAEEQHLSLRESIALGLQNSPSLHSSVMKYSYADAKAGEAAAGLYPTVKVQAGYQRLSDVPAFTIPIPMAPVSFPVVLNVYSAKATVQQPLFTGWKLQSAADAASFTAEASRNDLVRDKAELVYAIASAYWNVYRAREMKQVTEENVRQMASHLQDIESMQAQGMATLNDVLKVRVQLSNAKILDSDAENNVRMTVLSFDATLGIPLSTSIVLTSPLTPLTKELAPMGSFMTEAMENRPDLRGMEWRKRGAESGVAAARGGWLPQLYLTGNYYYSRPNSRIFPAKDEFKDTWDVGLSLQLDLWNNLTTVYQTDAARAQCAQAEDGIKALRDGITLEITQTYLQVNQNRERIALAQLAMQQSDENLRVAKEKFSVRLTANSELLDAEVAQVQARLQLTQAFVDYELSIARLEKAAGRGVVHDQQ